MPLVQVFTSASLPDEKAQQALLSDLSRVAAERFEKPERWVMTFVLPNQAMTFGGTTLPAALVVVRNIGQMTPDLTAGLSRAICDCLALHLGVPTERMYIDFQDAVDFRWGWNGGTFA